MKKLTLVALAAVAMLSAPAYAGVASQTFNVNVTLTSLCKVKTNTLGLTFTYTAFGAAQAGVAGGAATFECTRGFGAPPTVAFDTTNGGSSAAGQGATGDGEVKGIAYTLAVSAGVAAAGTDATATTVGTATEYPYTLTGGLLATQAGGGGTAGPVTRTLMLAY
jgi:hypothetical protein